MKAEGFREKLRNLKKALTPGADGTTDAPEKKAAARKKGDDVEAVPTVKGLLTWPAQFQGKVISWRSPLKNTRLLVAYLPGTDPHDPLALVSVFVRDNRNFLPGMEVPVRKIDDRTYELVGPCPARRGRWR